MNTTASPQQRSVLTHLSATAWRVMTFVDRIRGGSKFKLAAAVRAIEREHTALTSLLLRAKFLKFSERFPKGLVGIEFELERVYDGSETIVTSSNPVLVFRVSRTDKFSLPLYAGAYAWEATSSAGLAFLYGGSVADVDYETYAPRLAQKFPDADSVYRFADEIYRLSGLTSYRLDSKL